MSGGKLYNDVPKLILGHYEMFMDSRITIRTKGKSHTLIIYNWIVFTPKEISEFTPKRVNFYSKYKVDILDDLFDFLSYEDATYIRSSEMPLLKYVQGEYYLDEFCDKLSHDKVDEIVDEYLKGKVTVKPIITIGNTIHTNYDKNNF